jgi:anti-sigma regulatory factor (Ser/Thr protein kinase)
MIRTPSGWSHQIVLAADPMSAAVARDFVAGHLLEHDLPEMVDDLRLVVSELATNAVAHARTPFRVTLSTINRSVRIEIQDASASVPVRATPDEMAPGGRGLVIVDRLSQEWGTRTDDRGQKSVWASF